MTAEWKRRRRAMLHGTVSLRDTRGRWVDVGSAARTTVHAQTVDRLHLLARIYAQAEPYRLEVWTDERPDEPPVTYACDGIVQIDTRPGPSPYLIAGE